MMPLALSPIGGSCPLGVSNHPSTWLLMNCEYMGDHSSSSFDFSPALHYLASCSGWSKPSLPLHPVLGFEAQNASPLPSNSVGVSLLQFARPFKGRQAGTHTPILNNLPLRPTLPPQTTGVLCATVSPWALTLCLFGVEDVVSFGLGRHIRT